MAPSQMVQTRRLIWLYVLLLFFEGALRKWILPQLSEPLLVIRDPVVLAMYAFAVREGAWKSNGFIVAILLLGIVSGLSSLIFTNAPIFVTAFGLRTNFLHFPAVFVIAKAFRRSDLRKLGALTLALAPAMGFLMVIQFLSPPASFWNRGSSGADSGQLVAALGRIRPAATFSFISGSAQFLVVASAFWITGVLRREYGRILLVLSAIGILFGLVVSGSRYAVASTSLVAVTALGMAALNGKHLGRVILGGVVLGICAVGMSRVAVVSDGIEVLGARVDAGFTAEGGAGGFVGRFLRDYSDGLGIIKTAPLFGYGLGIGTNVGAKLISGQTNFLLSEAEWGRVILESGPILGVAFILWRVGLGLHLLVQVIRSYSPSNPLPLLLLVNAVLWVLSGQLSQATTLGFAVVLAGLCLAATDLSEVEPTMEPREGAPDAGPNLRGRSKYADTLHTR